MVSRRGLRWLPIPTLRQLVFPRGAWHVVLAPHIPRHRHEPSFCLPSIDGSLSNCRYCRNFLGVCCSYDLQLDKSGLLRLNCWWSLYDSKSVRLQIWRVAESIRS